MAYGESLPWELTEEILSRLPPKSLVRFRAVSTQWNRLFKDKTFIRNHKNKMTPRFILVTTTSKIYSVSINPKKEIYSVNELALDIPGLETQRLRYLVGRNELLLCRMEKGAAIWNPWLKQTRWIEDDVNQNISKFVGVGHNNKSYMVLGFCRRTNDNRTLWKIYDFDSDAWKDQDRGSSNGKEGHPVRTIITDGNVSLNGNLYWVSYSKKASDGLSIMQYDFSKGKFKLFCDLPCGTYHRSNASALAVFKEDRFSLLKQCHATKNLEVWVTKNKINSESGDDVEWIKFMEVSSPDLPVLVQPGSNAHPSYFIEDQTLVVCFCENGRAWIYLLGENKLIRKIQIDHVDGPWHLQRTCTPTLVQVPLLVQKEETELQV